MRKKLNEIRNKEEGFTLVELLAVIAILAILVAIAIPAIGNVIDDARGDATTAQAELVEDAARLYYTLEEDVKFETGKNTITVSAADLVKAGYLEKEDKVTGNVTITKATADDDDKSITYKYTP